MRKTNSKVRLRVEGKKDEDQFYFLEIYDTFTEGKLPYLKSATIRIDPEVGKKLARLNLDKLYDGLIAQEQETGKVRA